MSDVADKELLEQEARIALLQHYSSKSSNQATILLGIVLAAFTFIQTLPLVQDWDSYLRTLYEILSPSLLAFLAFRTLARLYFWGKLADTIQGTKPRCRACVNDKIRKEREKPTYFLRFSYRIDLFQENQLVKVTTYLISSWSGLSTFLGILSVSSAVYSVTTHAILSSFETIVVSVFGAVFAFVLFRAGIYYRDAEKKSRKAYEDTQKRAQGCTCDKE